MKTKQTDRTDWILHCAVQDIGFKSALKDLSVDQIRYCLEREKRKSAIDALKREARRKGITLDEPVTCPKCGWDGLPKKEWKAVVCPRCQKWISLESK